MVKTRIFQFTPSIAFGDAVSNDVLAMHEVLLKINCDAHIVSINIDKNVKADVMRLSEYDARPDDIIIFHMSIGSEMPDYLTKIKVKRIIMVYHNITPGEFFADFPNLKNLCDEGRRQLEMLVPYVDFAIADSDYNRAELDELKYKQTATLPIVFDKSEYLQTEPSQKLIRKYDDGYTNILFVGRIAPNKKQQDIIHSYHLYNKYINSRSRLFILGSKVWIEPYLNNLRNYIEKNDIKNVVFSGHVTFPEILGYYKSARVFLCESEHEGFCVPLLEAMIFDVPIIAYASSAIPSTLGESGVIFKEKDHRMVAELIDTVASNNELREQIIKAQRNRLDDFDINKTKALFEKLITPWLD